MINYKIVFSLKKGLKIVCCIGERIEEKNQGKTLNVIKKQVEIGLNGVNNKLFDNIIFAYEPVWAIGTGITAEPEQASSVHGSIKKFISERFNCHISKIRVMYGGSVNSDNIDSLISQPNNDGVLVGGASSYFLLGLHPLVLAITVLSFVFAGLGGYAALRKTEAKPKESELQG